jgi:hypothetical protein
MEKAGKANMTRATRNDANKLESLDLAEDSAKLDKLFANESEPKAPKSMHLEQFDLKLGYTNTLTSHFCDEQTEKKDVLQNKSDHRIDRNDMKNKKREREREITCLQRQSGSEEYNAIGCNDCINDDVIVMEIRARERERERREQLIKRNSSH